MRWHIVETMEDRNEEPLPNTHTQVHAHTHTHMRVHIHIQDTKEELENKSQKTVKGQCFTPIKQNKSFKM